MKEPDPMPEETPETPTEEAAKPSILKGWAAIIASIAALVTATGAILKPQDDSATKATYETLSKAVKDNSEQNAKNHDDLVALRNYLEGYMRANGAFPAATASAAPSVSAAPPASVALTHPTHPTVRPSASAALPPPVATLPPVATVLAAPLPSMSPRPEVWHPPTYDKASKK